MRGMLPVYIPTRGRAADCRTARLLDKQRMPYTLVVEAPEAQAYADRHPDAITLALEAEGRGISYARNATLAAMRAAGHRWAWMLDDDITGFCVAPKGRCTRAPASEVLVGAAEVIMADPEVAYGALEYVQYAWQTDRPNRGMLVGPGYCDVAVLVDTRKTFPIRYRGYVDLKEDRDFVLQVLALGHKTARATRFAFECPANGSNPGGLSPTYAEAGKEVEACRRMVELWGPGVCREIRKPDGRRDVRINWRAFAPPGG